VSLFWSLDPDAFPQAVHIERSVGADGPFHRITSTSISIQGFADVQVTNGVTYHYRLVPTGLATPAPSVAATPGAFPTADGFLEHLQRCAFAYFWHETNPANGLVRDRSTPSSPASIAAMGFALTASGIGIDHQWIPRDAGRDRALATLRFLDTAPQSSETNNVTGHRGWYYHFLNLKTGHRQWRCELSSVDTAWLLAGVVYAREYFDRSHPDEIELRRIADRLLGRVDWRWMLNGNETLSMGWHPETEFLASQWVGYNEAMWLLLLGLGTGEGGLSKAQWDRWCGGYRWQTSHGQSFVHFAPLFGHQYSHCWTDFRGVADDFMRRRGIDYFENSRRATLAQQAYCAANPSNRRGYSSLIWGLTACDGPGAPGYHEYMARGAPPAENDDGTIAPAAAGGSIPFAPEICLPTLRHFHEEFRAPIWRPYGFCDAFNLQADWFAPDVLGIDQGPILLMIENHRTGRVWKTFMRAPEIRRGLERAGFQAR
jgi:hypothetical protein